MELTIGSLTGTTICTLTCQRSQTVLEVKAAIRESTKTAVHLQKLLWGTALLNDTDFLSTAFPAGDSFELLLVCAEKWVHEVTENWRRLRKAPEIIRNDRDVVLAAIERSNGLAIKFAGNEVRSDREVMLAAMHHDMALCKYATEGLCTNRTFMMMALEQKPCLLWNSNWHVSSELCRDREFMLLMVKKNGFMLQHAVPELRADREVVHSAVQSQGQALEYASPALRGDKGLALLAVSPTAHNLEHVLPELRADRDFVLSALRKCPLATRRESALKHLSEELRANREVVTLAVSQRVTPWRADELQYASTDLQADRILQDLASHPKAALHPKASHCPLQFQDVSPKEGAVGTVPPQRGESIISDETRCAMKFAPPTWEKDHGFILPLLQRDPELLGLLGPEAQADRTLVLKAVRNCGRMLKFASENLRMDVEVVLVALKNSAEAYEFVPEQLRFNREIVLAGMQRCGVSLPKRLLADRDVVMAAAVQRGKLGATVKKALGKMSVQTIVAKYELM